MTTAKDRTFRVESVPFGKDLMAFSRVLEEKLNELVENGYSTQLMPTPRGVVVLGQRKAPPRDSLLEALAAILGAGEEPHKAPEDTVVEIPERLKVLLNLIEERAGTENIAEMTKALPHILPTLLKGAPSEAIFKAAKDCEDIVHHHGAHKTPGDCTFSIFLKALAQELRGFIKLHVQ